jgi:hypothetical protein
LAGIFQDSRGRAPEACFSVGAIAIAHRQANAVGAVRLTCAPGGLEIELLRVGNFAVGFAPGAVVEAVRFQVPYVAIRGLVRKGRMLLLALDPAVATPYNRFALTRFSDDPTEALVGACRARARARAASLLAPLPMGLLATAVTPRALVSGAVGLAALGAVAAVATWSVLREIAGWISWGGPISDRYQEALEVELSRRLGLAPAPVAPLWQPPPEPEPPDQDPADASALPTWARAPSRTALLVAAIAIAVVGVMAFLKRYSAPSPTAPPAYARIESGIGASVRRIAERARIEEEPPLPSCVCERAESPLWKDGVPVLSVVLTSLRDDGLLDPPPAPPSSAPAVPAAPPKEPEAAQAEAPSAPKTTKSKRKRKGKKPKKADNDVRAEEAVDVFRYDFDLAVVNNGRTPLNEVRVVVTFARRSPEGKRVGITERGLYWGRELGPGRSVKWHVTAPGTEMRIDSEAAALGAVAEGEAAPADAFFELTSARSQAVRDHAALMLAYLRDPRAEAAAQGIVGSAPREKLRADILRASQPLIACDLAIVEESSDDPGAGGAAPGELGACLFNGSTRPRRGAVLHEVDGAARSWTVRGKVPVHEGVKVRLPLQGGPVPSAIEVSDPAP